MKLIGKMVTIKAGMYKGEWGIIKAYDEDYYYIALWNGDEQLVFTRNEFTVRGHIL